MAITAPVVSEAAERICTPGTIRCRSLMSWTLACSSRAPEATVTETGTFCRFSSTRRAVTTTSGRAVARSAGLGSAAHAGGEAITKPPASVNRHRILRLVFRFISPPNTAAPGGHGHACPLEPHHLML